MKEMGKTARVLRAVRRYLIFFLLVAFLITCCTMLFVSVLSSTLGITLTEQNVNVAAKVTFVNVVVLTLLLTVVDGLRRRVTVDRPVQRIVAAAEQVIKGDLSVRIEPSGDEAFGAVIDCFNQMTEELSGVETLRTDFIANVSHEMKTPLSVIQNYSTLLASPALSEERRVEYAKAIGEASRRLGDMMTNILKLNRLENQQIYPLRTEYDLGEQLCECLLGFERVWEDRDIDIQTQLEEGVTVCADRELLSLVWNNLLSNAFKFTADGGRVKVSLWVEGTDAVVRVEDNGCGMSPEVGAHIFEKFYQGDASRATQGNGLGLALVKRVIDIMQGRIEVESTVGIGTVFTVRIRRRQNEAM